VGLAAALVQGGLIRVVMPRLGERRALLVGLAFSVAGYVAFGAATRGWMFYAIIFPFALGGLAGPATQSLISRQVGPSEQGEIQGTLASLMSMMAIVGPLLGTNLFARFSPATASPRIPGAHFFAAACLNACGLLLAARLFARTPEAAPAALPEG
jgi:DHA1 family tetracycline resistance protein-like MFS transporter